MSESETTRRLAADYVDSLERRDWVRLATLLSEDVVYELPQTRERVSGRPAFVRFNEEYPGDWRLRVRRLVADGRLAALWLDVTVSAEQLDACVWIEASGDGLICRITDFWPDRYEPPPGREHLVERW